MSIDTKALLNTRYRIIIYINLLIIASFISIEVKAEGYGNYSDYAIQDIYGDTTPLLLNRPTNIDLSAKTSALDTLEFQETATKSIRNHFDDFMSASFVPYIWNWTERLILAQNNVKQVFTEFPKGYIKKISGWQECKLIYCSAPYQKSPFWSPPLNDGDTFRINYIEHPISGMATYLYYRAAGFDRTSAGIGSFVHSILFEYTIEGFQQPPSFNDIILTPLIGVPLGVFVELTSDWLEQRDSQFLKGLSYIVNPTKILFPQGEVNLQGFVSVSFAFNWY